MASDGRRLADVLLCQCHSAEIAKGMKAIPRLSLNCSVGRTSIAAALMRVVPHNKAGIMDQPRPCQN
jgi:hypothetical protein